MLNVKKLAIAQTADMPVCDAAGVPQFDGEAPVTITLYSPASKQFRKAKHDLDTRQSDRMLARMQAGGDKKSTVEEQDADIAQFLAACTSSFNGLGMDDADGNPLAGYELYKAVYANPDIGHIADAANKFLGSRANFLPKPPAP